MEELIGVLAYWLPWLFGAGAVLVAGGLLTKELASVPSKRRLGHEAISAGGTMMVLAAIAYVLVRALPIMFSNFMSNLP